MLINADFSAPALALYDEGEWISSPMAGVERRMLDRIGGEVARATSLVRYAPGSHFSPHTHDGGEEFLVLEGVFQDEHGDYPTGTYVRNPPNSAHKPRSEPGCVILVKLHQFDLADRYQMALETADRDDELIELYRDSHEHVRIERWMPGEQMALKGLDGVELFVIEGSVIQGDVSLGRWSWLREPADSTHQVAAGSVGARVWIKSGHLAEPRMGAVKL